MSMNPLELMVRKFEMYANLTADDRKALLNLPTTLRSMPPSAYIVREGEPVSQHYVLAAGYAFRHKMTGDGKRQIVSMHIPGEAIACSTLFLAISDHNAQTLTHAEVAVVPRDALRALALERAAIGHAILMITLVEASILSEWLLNTGQRPAIARVAHLLCEFAARLDAVGQGGRNGYELPLSQEQLGDAVGLTSVHVNRMLKSLKGDGLIEQNARKVRFPDWKALRKAADFSELYLHLEQVKGG